VMTENELMKRRPTPQSIGMGSYTIDSHNVQRYITPEGYVQNEGDIGVPLPGPYEIAYGALVPKRGQADNLIVPVCVSSSHIAFGSIRMEPVFMVLAQSAATAAAMAIDAKGQTTSGHLRRVQAFAVGLADLIGVDLQEHVADAQGRALVMGDDNLDLLHFSHHRGITTDVAR